MYGSPEVRGLAFDEDYDIKNRMNHVSPQDVMMQKMETTISLMHVIMEMMRRTNIHHWDYELLETLQKQTAKKLLEIDFTKPVENGQ